MPERLSVAAGKTSLVVDWQLSQVGESLGVSQPLDDLKWMGENQASSDSAVLGMQVVQRGRNSRYQAVW